MFISFFLEVCLGESIKEMDHTQSKKDAAYEENGGGGVGGHILVHWPTVKTGR